MRRAKPFQLSRRTVLRGLGATLALPWLEVMGDKQATAATSTALPRVFFVYFPTGYRQGTWVANKQQGADYQLPAIASALDPVKKKLTLITGLSNEPAAVGNGGDGIHARGTGCFLTNEVLQAGGFGSGVSADQWIAKAVGAKYCIPSLAIGIPDERPPNFAEDGYGSVYYNNISFTGPKANVQRENEPIDLFNRITKCGGVGIGGGAVDPIAGERAAFEKSVMGSVKDEATHLMGCVGKDDRLRLEQYYDSIAELEKRFQAPNSMTPTEASCNAFTAPPANGGSFIENSELMIDVSLVALKCGLTPVVTMMLDGAFSHRDYGLTDIDGVDYCHGLSHGEIGGVAVDHPRWTKITTHFFAHFAYLLRKMDEVNEGGSTLLDNSIVYISSEFGDGNAHSIKQLPVLIGGSGGGRLNTGRHIAAPDNMPSANAILDVMKAAGVDKTSHGNSTGSIPGLLI